MQTCTSKANNGVNSFFSSFSFKKGPRFPPYRCPLLPVLPLFDFALNKKSAYHSNFNYLYKYVKEGVLGHKPLVMMSNDDKTVSD